MIDINCNFIFTTCCFVAWEINITTSQANTHHSGETVQNLFFGNLHEIMDQNPKLLQIHEIVG